MKKFWSDFFLRGLIGASGGPVILAVIYWILGRTGAVDTLTPDQVATGILSITLLAMMVAGMSAIYQLEQLPLLTAILLHGAALYLAYILTYLLNGWLQQQLVPILVFTVIFAAGYALIWVFIYLFTKARTERINAKLPKV